VAGSLAGYLLRLPRPQSIVRPFEAPEISRIIIGAVEIMLVGVQPTATGASSPPASVVNRGYLSGKLEQLITQSLPPGSSRINDSGPIERSERQPGHHSWFRRVLDRAIDRIAFRGRELLTASYLRPLRNPLTLEEIGALFHSAEHGKFPLCPSRRHQPFRAGNHERRASRYRPLLAHV